MAGKKTSSCVLLLVESMQQQVRLARPQERTETWALASPLQNKKLATMDRSEFPHLTDSQFESVRKMAGIFGMDAFRSLAAATPAVQVERVTAFDMCERWLIEHVRGTFEAPLVEPRPASKNFARQQTVARNRDKFEDALRESERSGVVAVRLADGTVVEVPKVQVDLAVKFEDIDSVESFIVLETDNNTSPGSIGAAKPLGLAGLQSLTEPWTEGVRWNRQDAAASEEYLGASVVGATSPHTRSDRRPWMAGATGGGPCPTCGSATTAGPHARSRSDVQAATVVVPQGTNQVHKRMKEFRREPRWLAMPK
ncbi:hypothetical protein P3T76_001853 [Phytophthora citrophthora]|uniref:Uncharacterized protein n=1 Tax=Phytophthora citrophthora TaxID=4793 RepID=A0AAD9GWI8_9STRA|nr:hypothetical protein P3T76_001853 [Phytophthora citrophthora]